MLEVINENYLFEMATINPKFSRGLPIHVAILQGGEGPIPHVHITSTDGKLNTCVSLLKPEYFEHGKYKGKMSSKQKELFIEVMTRLSGQYDSDAGLARELTGYQSAVKIWVDTYEDSYEKFGVDRAFDLDTLDYSKLETRK